MIWIDLYTEKCLKLYILVSATILSQMKTNALKVPVLGGFLAERKGHDITAIQPFIKLDTN